MDIISRQDWGAKYARGFRAAPLPARALWEHHSATTAPPPNATFEQDAAAVRTLERIGQERFRGGISYTFAVCPSGRVFEGHGVDRQGAHTGGQNTTSRAICLVGNYDTAKPTEAMLDAVAELVAHGHREGWWPAQLTGGHRDAPGASTACPGRHAHALIGEINRRARAPKEDDMSRAEVDEILQRIDVQVGFARNQVLAALGVAAPESAPEEPPVQFEVARRVDVGLVRDLIEALDVSGVSAAEFAALTRRVEALEARTPGGTS